MGVLWSQQDVVLAVQSPMTVLLRWIISLVLVVLALKAAQWIYYHLL